jgi:hypothetical protein
MHVPAGNKKERLAMSARYPSADKSFGRLLSWVDGKRKMQDASSRTDQAAGELISWIAGKDKTASDGSSTGRAAGRLFSWIAGKKGK